MNQTRTLTYFLQHSGRVLPELEHGVVTLRRRDGADVDLMTRGQREALGLAVRVLAEVAHGGAERAVSVLPWLSFLDRAAQSECIREITEVARAAVETGRLDRLEDVLYAWRATGLAAWDERQLRERGIQPAGDERVAIERPGGGAGPIRGARHSRATTARRASRVP